ncbi:MAG TPA: hypothetical protein PKI03_26455 [Pseudomonadota bacterium]|nr:hypothetical protein [Pseudomonadota bacterium]
MAKFDDFDPSDYMSTPRLDVPSLIALGQKLLLAAPAGLPKAAETSKATLQAAIEALLSRWQSGPQEDPAQRMRPVDVGADTSWACLKGRLEPHAWLDPTRSPDATVARELLGKLFPSGLSFTQLEYAAQWAEATRRIHLIADEGLEPTLRRLCGDLFVDELLHWHGEYTKMIGAVSEPEPGSPQAVPSESSAPSLHVVRRQAAQAILAWQVQLVALHLTGHPGAREGLHPTDDCRNLPRS